MPDQQGGTQTRTENGIIPNREQLNVVPQAIRTMPNNSKRYIAGLTREAFFAGVEFCQQRSGQPGSQNLNRSELVGHADKFISQSVPWLEGVVSDSVRSSPSSSQGSRQG